MIPGSPCIPIPISIFPSGIEKPGLPTSGIMQGVRATPMLLMLSLALLATRSTSSNEYILSAAAPATLNANTMPATPLRKFLFLEEATSSVTRTAAVFMPSNSTSSLAIVKFIWSPP